MARKERLASGEAHDLDSLNAKARRRRSELRLMEATIEAKAKERRRADDGAKERRGQR